MNEARLKELRHNYYAAEDKVAQCKVEVTRNFLDRDSGLKASKHLRDLAIAERNLWLSRILNEIGD